LFGFYKWHAVFPSCRNCVCSWAKIISKMMGMIFDWTIPCHFCNGNLHAIDFVLMYFDFLGLYVRRAGFQSSMSEFA
jgi:hypothetical protein